MDLLGMLRKLGDRLGIIEMSADPAQASLPVKIQTRSITLDELVSIHIQDVQELAGRPTQLPVSFEEIFRAAKINAPSSGWTVDRLREFLNTERIRAMDRTETQRETLQILAAEKVDAADIIKDAIARDQALDAFAEFTLKKIQSLKDQLDAEEKNWNKWRALKRQREQEMARAVGFLIDKEVISIEKEE
jgi:hypothetical protein